MSTSDAPDFATLEADPEIAPLLDFAPVPRQYVGRATWTPDMQRMFIAWLAFYGSANKACIEVQKSRSGVDRLYAAANADEFRAAWDGAKALFERRRIAQASVRPGGTGALRPPPASRDRLPAPQAAPEPGQVINELGELEDEASFQRRGEDARDSIANKLLRSRRLYLRDISDCPGKRAAFEILTELPIDWDRAERLEPQPDEPYNIANQRQPDMILTAQSGWSFGEFGYGPDRKAQRRREIDEYRASEGLEPVDWDAPYDEDEEDCE